MIQSKIIKAGNLPSVGLIGGYGLNYPNNIVFPPMDQTLRFGFIGAKVSYDISSLYHNRNKIKAADHRIEERKLEQKYLKENLYEQKQSLYIKYMEALNRINVTKKSIAQAAANYDIINKKEDMVAERVYALWPDLEKKAREQDIPIWSLESRRPLKLFDMVGFTLQYELSYPTLIGMLEHGGVPVRAVNRDVEDPYVIGGGAGAFNPEPIAPFFDAFLCSPESIVKPILSS